MTEREIKSNLCYYDLRNPDCLYSEQELKEYKEIWQREAKKRGLQHYCSCENCFYGLTELAEEIIKLKNEKESNENNLRL